MFDPGMFKACGFSGSRRGSAISLPQKTGRTPSQTAPPEELCRSDPSGGVRLVYWQCNKNALAKCNLLQDTTPLDILPMTWAQKPIKILVEEKFEAKMRILKRK